MIGAVIADRLLGKYRTILWLSLVYCQRQRCRWRWARTRPGACGLGLGLDRDRLGRHQAVRLRARRRSVRPRQLVPAAHDLPGVLLHHQLRQLLRLPADPVDLEGAGRPRRVRHPGRADGGGDRRVLDGAQRFIHVPPKPGRHAGAARRRQLDRVLPGDRATCSSSRPALAGDAGAVGRVHRCGRAAVPLAPALAPDDGFLAVTARALSAAGCADPGSEFWAPARARFGATTVEGPIAVLRIASVFVMVSVFWALFDQKASSWILQAADDGPDPVGGFKVLSVADPGRQPRAGDDADPVRGSGLLYPSAERLGFPPTPLRRMTAGLVLAALAFVAHGADPGRHRRARRRASVWFGWQLVRVRADSRWAR